MTAGIEISVVAPVLNGVDTIFEYILRTENILQVLNNPYQIILVDDGSTDSSLSLMRELQEENPAVMIIKLAKNYGQSNAIAAGLLKAEGNYIVVMDSDLQDMPEDIILLYHEIMKVKEDMIIVTRRNANMPLWRNLCSLAFYIFTVLLTKLRFPYGSGVFRIMKHKCIDHLEDALQTPGTVLSYIHARGYSWTTMFLSRDDKRLQKSNYNLRKMLHLAQCRIFPYCRLPLMRQNGDFVPEFSIEEIYGEKQIER
ncbi:MAG: glycosyltransferase [Candidatus Cloacimonetes bacterium]|nr:glycosyltransferase [Candidatus Cloacimonadota bacterium]